jgi:hypothetical protein
LVDGVLAAESLPKASTNLVTTLSCLDADDFPHLLLPSRQAEKQRAPTKTSKWYELFC